MIFSLYRDETALDKELDDCLKGVKSDPMEVESTPPPSAQPSSVNKSRSKKTQQVTQVSSTPAQQVLTREETDLSQKMSKIKIGEDERAIRKITEIETRSKSNFKEIRSTVFKAFVGILKERRKTQTTFEELYKALPTLTF